MVHQSAHRVRGRVEPSGNPPAMHSRLEKVGGMGPPGGLIPRPPIYPGQRCLAERSFGLSAAVRVYLATEPADMRRSFDGLAAPRFRRHQVPGTTYVIIDR